MNPRLSNRLFRCTLISLLTVLTSAGCEPTQSDERQGPSSRAPSAFWASLQQLCGQAFDGELVRAPAEDTLLTGKRLQMHVRSCSSDSIHIPFHVAENRSRTWILSRAGDNRLRLAHRHLHRDGTPAANSGYGGITRNAERPKTREFFADTVNPSTSNIWRIAFFGDSTFVYGFRQDVDAPLLYELHFDLSEPVEVPPPPWGVQGNGE